MGRRRTKAPRHGSLAYLPRKRAKSPIGKVRYWPEVALDSPKLIGFSGYKVGMSHVYLWNEVVGSPRYGQEVYCPVTIIETPPLLVGGVRAYKETVNGLKTFTEVWANNLPRDTEKRTSKIRKTKNLTSILKEESSIRELRAIVLTQPTLASVPQKKPEIFEVKIGGGSLQDQLAYLRGRFGKVVEITEVFHSGQFIDVTGVTKGKGVQGPVKRWGVKKLPHKSRKTVRGIGTLGP